MRSSIYGIRLSPIKTLKFPVKSPYLGHIFTPPRITVSGPKESDFPEGPALQSKERRISFFFFLGSLLWFGLVPACLAASFCFRHQTKQTQQAENKKTKNKILI